MPVGNYSIDGSVDRKCQTRCRGGDEIFRHYGEIDMISDLGQRLESVNVLEQSLASPSINCSRRDTGSYGN
jgi:hypothetical protein